MAQRTGPSSISDSSPPPTLEEAVRVLWDEKPGTGVTELMAGVCRLLPHEAVQEGAGKAALKKRVKAAKSALSYARAETECAIQALSVMPDGPVKAALHEAALFAGKRAY